MKNRQVYMKNSGPFHFEPSIYSVIVSLDVHTVVHEC